MPSSARDTGAIELALPSRNEGKNPIQPWRIVERPLGTDEQLRLFNSSRRGRTESLSQEECPTAEIRIHGPQPDQSNIQHVLDQKNLCSRLAGLGTDDIEFRSNKAAPQHGQISSLEPPTNRLVRVRLRVAFLANPLRNAARFPVQADRVFG